MEVAGGGRGVPAPRPLSQQAQVFVKFQPGFQVVFNDKGRCKSSGGMLLQGCANPSSGMGGVQHVDILCSLPHGSNIKEVPESSIKHYSRSLTFLCSSLLLGEHRSYYSGLVLKEPTGTTLVCFSDNI